MKISKQLFINKIQNSFIITQKNCNDLRFQINIFIWVYIYIYLFISSVFIFMVFELGMNILCLSYVTHPLLSFGDLKMV